MPANIATLFNQKGGAGKTNLGMQIGGTLGMRGKKVLIVDIDPQSTATRWAGRAPEGRPFPARVINLSSQGPDAYKEIRRYINDYDWILIDCPPSPIDSEAAKEGPEKVMLISDLTIIPVRPCPADMWAAQAAKQFVKRVMVLNDTMKVRVAPVMVDSQTTMAKDMLEVLRDDPAFPVFNTEIGERVAFQECQLSGGTVHHVQRSAASRVEINALVDEIEQLLEAEE